MLLVIPWFSMEEEGLVVVVVVVVVVEVGIEEVVVVVVVEVIEIGTVDVVVDVVEDDDDRIFPPRRIFLEIELLTERNQKVKEIRN